MLIFVNSASGTQSASAADAYADGRTDAMSFWFDPDLKPGETFLSYSAKKQYRYIYKEATILDSTNSTYFMITGANGYPDYPDFYGGVQQLYNGKRVALFSAWDLGISNCEYFSCKAEDAEEKNKVSLWAKGARTTSARGGGEGTFMQSFISDLDWEIGQKISWLVSLEPAGLESLLSVAIKLEGQPWEFFASYVIPARFKKSKDKNRHKVTVVGSSIIGQVGTEPQLNAQADYRVRLGMPTPIPDYSQGKALLDEIVKGKSTRYQEELKRLEQEAAAKAVAELKAKEEAEAKAVAELKAKEEAKVKEAARAASAKKTTITCVKGKLTKKVTAVKPKCPTGYKKK